MIKNIAGRVSGLCIIYCALYYSNDIIFRICSLFLHKSRDILQDNEWSGRDCHWYIVPFYLGRCDRDSKMQEHIK